MAPFSNKLFISSLISVSCLPGKCTCPGGDNWVRAVTNSRLYPCTVCNTQGSEVTFSQFRLAIANRPALGALANTSLRGIYISCVTQSLICIIGKTLFKFFFDRKHGFIWGFISTSTTVLILCPSWTPPASPSWTPQVSPSWTLCCLEGTSLRNVLVAFDSKRTIADLFSDRKGSSLENRSHFRPGRNGWLKKIALNAKLRTLYPNTPPPPNSPWPFFQNRVRTGK